MNDWLKTFSVSCIQQEKLKVEAPGDTGKHYKAMAVEPWEVMEAILTRDEFIGFLKGNIVKYAMRAGHKQGTDDAAKCRAYQEKLKGVQKDGHNNYRF